MELLKLLGRGLGLIILSFILAPLMPIPDVRLELGMRALKTLGISQ